MAINKNFVIKNGIQVNDNLFVADPDNNKIGINTALPEYELQVIGGIGVTDARVTGVTTALGDLLVGTDGSALAVKVSAGNSVGIGTNLPEYPLHVKGPASIGQVAGYVYGDLDVTGDISGANFASGSATFTGVSTFTDTTNNTLGDADTGAVQIDGGLGVNKNVTVGGGLSVTGNSFFVGVVTFAAGASGKIQLGDNADDNVEFQADVNSNIIPNTTSAFDLGTSSQEWRDFYLAGNAGIGSLSVTGISTFGDTVEISSLTENRIPIVGAGSTIEDDGNLTFDGSQLVVAVAATVGGALTVAGSVDLNADLDVDGRTELDITNISETLNVSGISTFGDTVEISSLTDNRIPIVGAGSSIEDDANLTFDGSQLVVAVGATVGGALTVAGNVDLNADLDVDGRTELDITNISETLNVTGISTFASDVDINANVDVSGNAGIGSLNVVGVSTFNDTVTFTPDGLLVGTISTTNQKFGGIAVYPELESTSSDAVLTNNNLTFTRTSGSGWRGSDSTLETKTSGKYYAEVTLDVVAIPGFISIGVRNNLQSGNINPGTDTNIIGQYENEYALYYSSSIDIRIRNNNTDLITSGGNDQAGLSLYNANDVIGILLDLDNYTLSFSQNGSIGNSVPIASGLNYEFALAVFNSDQTLTINFGETAFSSLPAGYQGLNQTDPYIEVTQSGLEFVGNSNFSDSLNVVGVSTFGGITTFTDTTENTLGTTDTGAVKIAGGLAVAKNATVGGGLSVTGNSYFVGMVTFAAGTDGNITIGDTSSDNVVFNADVNSNFIPDLNATYDLGSSSQKWADLYLAGNAGVGSVYVAGVSTFVGIATFNNGIVIHSGISTFLSTVDINGNLDVDGHTELDDLNVTGVATFAQTEISNINVSGVTTTQTLHVGTGGTTLTVDADNATFAIGSATTTVTATMNGGAIPSIGLVIALGG